MTRRRPGRPPRHDGKPPTRIAILGGGMGAVVAAFELTNQPSLRDRYEVTLYQMGWRLGGKGASGRNRRENMRIEEHGLHVWAGYYENAFQVIRRCYEELARPPGAPLATWDQAFKKKSFLSLEERAFGRWTTWNIKMPENDAIPGDGEGGIGARDYAAMGAGAIRDLLAGAHAWGAQGREPEHHLRRGAIAIDFVATILRGVAADRVLTRGVSALDDEDWATWLARHGASRRTLESPLVRGIYDLMFAYPGGDTSRPSMAASCVVHALYRFLLTYKGALFWEMQGGGMGDVVFAPLYEVLKRRGVRFKFFHTVTNLGLSPDRRSIASIRLVRQARALGGDYDPLISVKGLPCWPSEPLFERIEDGEAIERAGLDFECPSAEVPGAEEVTLEVGADFDAVVLGLSLGALRHVCPELIAANDRFRRMVEKIATVPTLAMQLWLDADTRSLGWEAPRTILCGYEQPFNTWADMSHLIEAEAFPEDAVRSIAYFCGPMRESEGERRGGPESPGQGDSARAKEAVRDAAIAWLREHPGHLFQRADGRPEIPWERLVAPAELRGERRFEAQYHRANVSPSDRYVLSLPGTNRYRLAAGDSGFENLYLAGDWVKTSFNMGTIEAAAIAGRCAARAICGSPASIPGEDDG